MKWEAITWQRMAERLAGHLDDPENPPEQGSWQRVGIDGAPAAETGVLAEELAEALRRRGRAVLVVATDGFLRPASLRFEFGRQDVDQYLGGWYDTAALWREVFGPTDPGGSGRVLPDLWDPVTDRATRSPYAELPPGGVLLVHGPLLLGQWFPFDLSVHIRLSPGALGRRTEESERWTVAAFARYEAEVDPGAGADVVVRADDSRHPAWTGVRVLGR
ncbi:uridine kinase [Streptomyces sp. NPDC001586]|uniref:uridine kinase n=1 Tax=Streptomyces sp. NPDC001586 TaxID=3154387 RepID=UPI00332A4443